MWLIIAVIVIVTLISIDGQLKKLNRTNETIIELLEGKTKE
ncbi:hypothetical protein [Paraliobacillus salinarum]|nr:hypothetical protein [Paraliobacillus salinarum]